MTQRDDPGPFDQSHHPTDHSHASDSELHATTARAEQKVAALIDDTKGRGLFESLAEENPNPIVRISADGTILYRNPATASHPGWRDGATQAPPLLAGLARTALSRDQSFERDVEIEGTLFAVTVVPIVREGCVNLYGRDVTRHRRVQEALVATERMYADLVKTANSIIIRWDNQGVIRFINDYGLRFFGYEPDELIGHDVMTIVPRVEASSGRNLDALVKDLVVHPELYTSVPNENITRDGRTVWVSWTNKAIVDQNGDVLEILAIGNDITALKAAEAETERVAQQRQLALDAARLGWWHYDPLTRIARWDDGYRRIFGVSGYERPNDEILTRIIHPEDLPGLWERVEAALDPADPQPFETVYRIMRPDGELRWIEAHGIASFDGEGEQRHASSFVGTVCDITTGKRAEHALQEALAEAESGDRMLKALMEHVPEGITIADEELNLILVSRHGEKLLGGTQEGRSTDAVAAEWSVFEVDGTTPMAFDDLPVVRAVRHGETVEDVELVQINAAGEKISLLCNAGPIHDGSGRIAGGVVVWRDITQRHRIEQAMAESLREKEALLKEVHHRVKNNMQVISSLVSLQDNALNDPRLHAALSDVRDRIRSMALVHEKLYQSKNLAEVDFAGYARSLLEQLWRSHRSESVAIRMELAPLCLPVDIAVPCGLILNELTTNTLKHAFTDHRSGQVVVTLKGEPSGQAHLTVADNGRGLPEGLDWRHSTSLGLSLVGMLARQVNGQIEARRSAAGGAEFELVFHTSTA